MITTLVVAFLMAHGLLHLVIWRPPASPQDEKPPPFHPDHSALLTMTAMPQTAVHQLSISLATVTTAAYLLAGIAVALSAAWSVEATVAAAVLGLALKILYFNPWLSVGVLLDVTVLLAALTQWPVARG